jgi:peptide/nickel transport system permease protein
LEGPFFESLKGGLGRFVFIVNETKKHKRSKGARFKKLIRQSPTALIGVLIVLFFVFLALLGPLITPYSASEQNMSMRMQPPSEEHLFGTDQYGRDVFSRIIIGCRNVGVVAGSGTVVAVVVGLIIGLISGYFGGILDDIFMRIMEVMMAIPALLFAMLILFSLGSSIGSVILVIGFLYSPVVARVVRSVVLDFKTRQFVEAAKLRGESVLYILIRELLPNVMPHLAVEASMRFVYSIFLVASLGFLGLGVQPPHPDWGYMINEARSHYHLAPWALLFQASAVAIITVGVGFMSDGLRKVLLPGGVSND